MFLMVKYINFSYKRSIKIGFGPLHPPNKIYHVQNFFNKLFEIIDQRHQFLFWNQQMIVISMSPNTNDGNSNVFKHRVSKNQHIIRYESCFEQSLRGKNNTIWLKINTFHKMFLQNSTCYKMFYFPNKIRNHYSFNSLSIKNSVKYFSKSFFQPI